MAQEYIKIRKSPSDDWLVLPQPDSGALTMYAPKYSTFSRMRGVRSRIRPMRDGMPLKYQMWLTGAASSMWPMRSRRTFARVTSTPQRSQILPL